MGDRGFLNSFSLRTDLIIHEYQETAHQRGLHGWDPRLKLCLLVGVVGLNVIVAQLSLSCILFLLGVIVALWSRIPFRLFMLFLLAPVWATLIVFLGFSVGFGTTAVAAIGSFTIYREGLLEGLSAAARVNSDMVWIAAVFLTTPFHAVIGALRWFRLPTLLVDTIGMAYRYAFLLMEEFQRMRNVSETRGGNRGYRKKLKSMAMLLAQVILRSHDRSRRIQLAMLSRGADAKAKETRNPTLKEESCPNKCNITPEEIDGSFPVLSCKNLTFSYGSTRIMKNVSLEVTKGEVIVLCGPNGSGKTTLLQLFSGILTPIGGEIYLCGRKMDHKSRKDAFRHVGILFQDPHDQLFCTTVREDIAYGPSNLGLEEDMVANLVGIAMDLMEVNHIANRPIHLLSHGEMKRVGLAGLIATRPPLILLDEPTASLDPASAQHLVRLIKHLNDHHGYTFVIVTHDINLAASIAKRIVILNEGRIAADGSRRNVLTDEELLKSARLEPPLLTKLFRTVLNDPSEDEIPITIEEAAEIMNPQGSQRFSVRNYRKML